MLTFRPFHGQSLLRVYPAGKAMLRARDVRTAQYGFMDDWTAAWRKYVGVDARIGTKKSFMELCAGTIGVFEKVNSYD